MSDALLERPDIRRVLELAAVGKWEVDIPRELKDAVYFCISNGYAYLVRAYAVGPSSGQPGLFTDRPMILPVGDDDPTYNERGKVLMLTESGDAALSKLRMLEKTPAAVQPVLDDSGWPTQTDVASRLKVSKTTVARLIKRGELKDNEKKGEERRVDPASLITYIHRKKVGYNET